MSGRRPLDVLVQQRADPRRTVLLGGGADRPGVSPKRREIGQRILERRHLSWIRSRESRDSFEHRRDTLHQRGETGSQRVDGCFHGLVVLDVAVEQGEAQLAHLVEVKDGALNRPR